MSDRQSKLQYGEFLRKQMKENEERKKRDKQKEVELMYGVARRQSRQATETTKPIIRRRTSKRTTIDSDNLQPLEGLQFQVKSLRSALSRQGKALTAELENIHRLIDGLRSESKDLRGRITIMRTIKQELRDDMQVISPLRRPKRPIKRDQMKTPEGNDPYHLLASQLQNKTATDLVYSSQPN